MKLIKRLVDSKVKTDLIKGFIVLFLLSAVAVLASFILMSSIFTNSPETQLSSITDLWNLLLGLPITAAGAIIAIILAQKSIDISVTQEKIEQQSLRLNQQLAEYEFKQEISKKWEDCISVYSTLQTAIEGIVASLNELEEWQYEPKHYLCITGTELSLLAKGSVQDAINIYVDHVGDAKAVKDKLISAFNIESTEALYIEGNRLIFDEDINRRLAFNDHVAFYNRLKNIVIPKLTALEVALKLMYKNPLVRELWVNKYDGYDKSNNFILGEALKELQLENECFDKQYIVDEFNCDIYATPLSLIGAVNRFKKDVLHNAASLYFLTSKHKNNNDMYPLSIITLLDMTYENERSDLLKVGKLNLEQDTDFQPFETGFFWDNLEPKTIVEPKVWWSRAHLIFRDVVRMLPTQKDMLTWSSDQFDLTSDTQLWLANNVFFDVGDLFENVDALQGYTDADMTELNQNEEVKTELSISARGYGRTGTTFFSVEFGKFLESSMRAANKNKLNRTSDEDFYYLSSINNGDWKNREPRGLYDEMRLERIKEEVNLADIQEALKTQEGELAILDIEQEEVTNFQFDVDEVLKRCWRLDEATILNRQVSRKEFYDLSDDVEALIQRQYVIKSFTIFDGITDIMDYEFKAVQKLKERLTELEPVLKECYD